jgi:hypothetical protein
VEIMGDRKAKGFKERKRRKGNEEERECQKGRAWTCGGREERDRKRERRSVFVLHVKERKQWEVEGTKYGGMQFSTFAPL